jgi:hypothetical protein
MTTDHSHDGAAAALPCPAEQPVVYSNGGTTNGITQASLPCILARGHDGHHVCDTPDGPYEFQGSA